MGSFQNKVKQMRGVGGLKMSIFAHFCPFSCLHTLESGIDVGQGITVGPRKLVKENKRRALNKRRA